MRKGEEEADDDSLIVCKSKSTRYVVEERREGVERGPSAMDASRPDRV
jgi:hypothetical protein